MAVIKVAFVLSEVLLIFPTIVATDWVMVGVIEMVVQLLMGIKTAAILAIALQVVPSGILVLLAGSTAQKRSAALKALGVFGFVFAAALMSYHC